MTRRASVFSKTKNGLTPLHMSIQGDHVECARKLLDYKADIEEVTMVSSYIMECSLLLLELKAKISPVFW